MSSTKNLLTELVKEQGITNIIMKNVKEMEVSEDKITRDINKKIKKLDKMYIGGLYFLLIPTSAELIDTSELCHGKLVNLVMNVIINIIINHDIKLYKDILETEWTDQSEHYLREEMYGNISRQERGLWLKYTELLRVIYNLFKKYS